MSPFQLNLDLKSWSRYGVFTQKTVPVQLDSNKEHASASDIKWVPGDNENLINSNNFKCFAIDLLISLSFL